MKKTVFFILLSLIACGCSAIRFYKSYTPAVEENWVKIEKGTYSYSLQYDSSMIEIREIPVKDIIIGGVVLVPFIPMKWKSFDDIYLDIHVCTNDTIYQLSPPRVQLYNPVTKQTTQALEVIPFSFDLVEKLGLYHRDFTLNFKYKQNGTFFYKFPLNTDDEVIYFKIDSLDSGNKTQKIVKYELKNNTKYRPFILPLGG